MVALLLLSAAGQAAAPVPQSAGWQPQTYPTVRAVTGVRLSRALAHSGKESLALAVQLNGAIPSRRQGEAFVDLRYHPPAGVTAPVDLDGQTLKGWVFAPRGLEGPARNPNGVRLFVKDSRWHTEYGTWTHLTPGEWMPVTFQVSATTPRQGYREAGFNPKQILLVGISIAAGARSTARFTGSLLLDDLSWGGDGGPRFDFEE